MPPRHARATVENGGSALGNLRADLPASVVVFLIAIPLSLGIALAAGAPVTAGLIAAAVGGIVAGALGGSRLQVSGPAAGLTVIVAELVQQYGWAATCALTVAAGLLQIAFGCLRVARVALAISPAIVHGMLAGIGIVIALAQIHVVLGGKPRSSATDNLVALPGQLLHHNLPALVVGALTVAVLLGWPRVPGRFRAVPAPLVAIVVATVAAWAGRLEVPRVDLPADLFGGYELPALPDASPGAMVTAILTLAAVASVESLLSAVAVDKMSTGPRAQLNRELVGQGAANAVSGALGGFPITGVIVRSSTNVKSGARGRASAVLHGVWVIVLAVFAAGLVEQIPLAALAALLVVVGMRMLDLHEIRGLWRHRELAIYLVTALGVIKLNLLDGVLLGIGVALLFALYRLTHTKVHIEYQGDRWHVVAEGSLTFLAVPSLTRTLSSIPAGAEVDVDLRVDFLDHAAFEALHTWRAAHERMGGRVDIDEIHESWYRDRAAGTPAGRRSVSWLPGFLPWSHRTVAAEPQVQLLTGVQEFQRTAAPLVRPVLERLARDGQSPSQLFIACSDSRLVPHLITASGPGDLFTVRNIGNLVPRHTGDSSGDMSVAAAIGYAVEVLNVSSITVCGHSGCGAMNALLDGYGQGAPRGALDSWLRHGTQTLARFRVFSTLRGGRDGEALEHLCQVNVVQQLDNLLTYPVVRQRVEAGALRVVGMYFDIGKAEVRFLDPRTGRFSGPAQANVTAREPAAA